MTGYLLRSLRAQLRSNGLLTALTIAGVALGVAAVLSIQIINLNAVAAFRGSVRAVSGEADLSVAGTTPDFSERLLVDILGDPDVRTAWPLYRLTVALEQPTRTFLDLVGIDLYQPTGLPLDSTPEGISAALTTRGWVALVPAFATAQGLVPGDTLVVTSGSRRVSLVFGTAVDFQRVAPLASSKLAVMDIAQVQGLFGQRGRVTQIDVRLREGADVATVAARLSGRLGAGVQVLEPSEREAQAGDLLAAFRLNLTALSLISLFVGVFLVYGSTQASLVRRRREFGLLRSIGATRRQVLGLLALEIALVGCVGVAIGLPLGYLVAAANLDTVSATISNLYLLSEIERLELPPALYLLAAAVGVGGAVVGGLAPAFDMSRRDPLAMLTPFTLHEKLRSIAGPMFAAGATVLGLTAAWYWSLGRSWQPAGFVLAVALMVGLSLLTPQVVHGLAAPLTVRRLGLAYSIKTLAARLQTTAVAVASLAVAVSMLVGITLMVGSFRRTVEQWIGQTVRADVYVTTRSWARAMGTAHLDSSVVATLASLPQVAAVDRLRAVPVTIEGRRIMLAGVDVGLTDGAERFALFAGDWTTALPAVRDRGGALISEPLARRLGLAPGDTLAFPTPAGNARLPVAGVYYDYGNESGAAIVDLTTLSALVGPGPISNVALYLEDGVDVETVVDDIRARFPTTPLEVRSNRTLRTEVLRIFDQTFAITRILQALCLVIAVAGIALTLFVLARERVAELALYRALGADRGQVFRIFLGKGAVIGGLAMVLGTFGGLALAAILILVINRAYFGWTIQLHWPWRDLALDAVVIVAASTAAGVIPALRAARVPATDLSRDDL